VSHPYIYLGVALLLIVPGILIKHFKFYWLIAGYNTMSRARKENVDIEGLGNFLGNWLFTLGALFLLAGLLGYLAIPYLDLISWSLFIAAIFFILIKAQRFDHNPVTRRDRIVLGLVLGVLALFGLAVAGTMIYSSLPPPIQVEGDSLEIGGIYGVSLPLSDIEDVALKETMPPITRKVNGFDAGPFRKGHFAVEDMGRGRLYLQAWQGPFLYIFHADGYVIINCHDRQMTEELYRTLTGTTGIQ
jgi:hypothetical protein